MILALLICSCGPPPSPLGRYQGDLTDPDGLQHECTLEITPTSPDRVHIHLDYGDGMCDGDGALILGNMLFPDAGGEITPDGYILNGNFFSEIGREYRINAVVFSCGIPTEE